MSALSFISPILFWHGKYLGTQQEVENEHSTLTTLIPKVRTHTTDMVVIDPTSNYLVQLGEDDV